MDGKHLKDDGIRIIESNEDILLYDTGHIPGAVHIDWRADLQDPVIRPRRRHNRPTPPKRCYSLGNGRLSLKQQCQSPFTGFHKSSHLFRLDYFVVAIEKHQIARRFHR
jgi:hypothetical protein